MFYLANLNYALKWSLIYLSYLVIHIVFTLNLSKVLHLVTDMFSPQHSEDNWIKTKHSLITLQSFIIHLANQAKHLEIIIGSFFPHFLNFSSSSSPTSNVCPEPPLLMSLPCPLQVQPLAPLLHRFHSVLFGVLDYTPAPLPFILLILFSLQQNYSCLTQEVHGSRKNVKQQDHLYMFMASVFIANKNKNYCTQLFKRK